MAAVAIANVVKSSLGPVGLGGSPDVEHPSGKVLVDLAQLQDQEVGERTKFVYPHQHHHHHKGNRNSRDSKNSSQEPISPQHLEMIRYVHDCK